METYIVTGIDRNGKRFRKEYDDAFTAMHINLWRGNVWRLVDGKKTRIKSVYN